jgi:glycosyltransferase involved in cell wall biosynthesis
MFQDRRIAVVVPAYNEAGKIARAVASIPAFVDHVIVVDDASRDDTRAISLACRRQGLEVLVHAENRGVGAAIATGYRCAHARGAHVTAVMAGDAQMDPSDLEPLLSAVVHGAADYAKGNRLCWPGVTRVMPVSRLFGNVVLSLLTRVATGYAVFDSQCGFTAASRRALETIISGTVFARYGYTIDVLARLRAARVRVVDVPVRPIYGPSWSSGIRPLRVIGPLLFVLGRALGQRIAGAWGQPARVRFS